MRPRLLSVFVLLPFLGLSMTQKAQADSSERSSIIPDSLIQAYISEIHPDSVRHFIQGLQDFGTRYCLAPNRDSISNWIHQQFLTMGYTDVAIDSFQFQNTWQKNVVATLPGTSKPDRVVAIGAHHDSYSTSDDPMIYAPGADDNGSGTAAVLEIARIMSRKGFHPKSTIKFMTFAAEELGLYGSVALANEAKVAGMNITLMMNADMISYTTQPLSNSLVGICSPGEFSYLADAASRIAARFTVLTPRTGQGCFSDDCSFRGFPTVAFSTTEGIFPFVHSSRDVVSRYNMDYCAEVIKVMCALAMYGSSALQPVRNLTVQDPGNGVSLLVQWNRNPEPELSGYRVRIGKVSAKYDTVLTTTDTAIVVRNLAEGGNTLLE